MKFKELPEQSYLKECFDYNGITGVLTWKKRPENHFAGSRSCNSWNSKNAGNTAFNVIEKSGYCRAALNGRKVLAQRVIWKWLTGEEPENVDHLNGVRHDNRQINLGSSNKKNNMRNKSLYSNNSHGIPGLKKSRGGYSVYLGDAYLGFRRTLEEATSLRMEAQNNHPDYSERHGK